MNIQEYKQATKNMSKKEIEEFNLKLLRELDPDWDKEPTEAQIKQRKKWEEMDRREDRAINEWEAKYG